MRSSTTSSRGAVPRPVLHERIARRAEAMLAAGVVDEVQRALSAAAPSATAARALGLDELAALLDGRLDAAACTARLVERTRAYARRQEIWMRRLPDLELLDGTASPDASARCIEDCLLS